MNESDFCKLKESIKQAGEIRRGILTAERTFYIESPNVKDIRSHLSVSQGEFASMIGVSVRTLQNWEQGRRKPEGPAKALLRIASKNPKAVMEALHA